MTVVTRNLTFVSEGTYYTINISDTVRALVKESGIREGLAHVYLMHTTGIVMIAEHEAGIMVDFEDMLERIIPVSHPYTHHIRGYDQNGAAHVRSALGGVSVTIPVIDGELMLGDLQEILITDLDPAVKTRTAIVQVIGEE